MGNTIRLAFSLGNRGRVASKEHDKSHDIFAVELFISDMLAADAMSHEEKAIKL
jgi:hypothetical protein